MRRLLIFWVLALIGLAATMMVHGGWQAVAAAFTIAAGGGFAFNFVALRAASERPRSRRPTWATAEPAPREAAVAVPAPGRSQPARSSRRPLAPRHQGAA